MRYRNFGNLGAMTPEQRFQSDSFYRKKLFSRLERIKMAYPNAGLLELSDRLYEMISERYSTDQIQDLITEFGQRGAIIGVDGQQTIVQGPFQTQRRTPEPLRNPEYPRPDVRPAIPAPVPAPAPAPTQNNQTTGAPAPAPRSPTGGGAGQSMFQAAPNPDPGVMYFGGGPADSGGAAAAPIDWRIVALIGLLIFGGMQ